jgi:hypothetical protein
MLDVQEGVARTRLFDAAAALDPADRALLDLWVNRGLDDAALAGLSRLSVGAITARRHTLIERLSTDLELAPERVNDALQALAAGEQALATARAPADPDRAQSGGADTTSTPTARPAQPTPAGPAATDSPGAAEGRRGSRRGSLIAVGVVFVAVLVRGRRRAHRRW